METQIFHISNCTFCEITQIIPFISLYISTNVSSDYNHKTDYSLPPLFIHYRNAPMIVLSMYNQTKNEIPVIDISSNRQHVLKLIVNACEKYGFLWW